MNNKNTWIVVVVLVIALTFGAYLVSKKYGAIYKDPLLERQIEFLQKELKDVQSSYKELEKELAKKTAQHKAIKPPKTEQEVKDRSKALGYPAIR